MQGCYGYFGLKLSSFLVTPAGVFPSVYRELSYPVFRYWNMSNNGNVSHPVHLLPKTSEHLYTDKTAQYILIIHSFNYSQLLVLSSMCTSGSARTKSPQLNIDKSYLDLSSFKQQLYSSGQTVRYTRIDYSAD